MLSGKNWIRMYFYIPSTKIVGLYVFVRNDLLSYFPSSLDSHNAVVFKNFLTKFFINFSKKYICLNVWSKYNAKVSKKNQKKIIQNNL